MNLMKVILRTSGVTAAILSFATFSNAQTRIVPALVQVQHDQDIIHVGHNAGYIRLPAPDPVDPRKAVSPGAPFAEEELRPVVAPKVKKPSPIKRLAKAIVGAPASPTATPPTPVGVQVVMSDGSVQTFPLGLWLEFKNSTLKGVFPTQYVNQIATVQPDGTWKYTRPGRNVQVWRNGVLQRQGPDYTLNQAGATITPVMYQNASGVLQGWNNDDYVTVAYLY
jgi:hypothetical protein